VFFTQRNLARVRHRVRRRPTLVLDATKKVSSGSSGSPGRTPWRSCDDVRERLRDDVMNTIKAR